MPEYLNLMLRRSLTAATFFIALTGAPALLSGQTAPPDSPRVEKQTPATPSSTVALRRGKKAKQQQGKVIPPPPPPPPIPEQMPSVAPEVIYRGGMLSIDAPNSTMNDVLSAVRRVTGATIEKPPVGGADRVVARLGPGQPKDVLEALFKGSRYDYIILGSTTRPGGVDRIILTARANAAVATAMATNDIPGQPPKPNVRPQPPSDQDEPETDTEDMAVPERDQAEPEQPQLPQPPSQPQALPGQPPQTPEQQNQNQQPRVKSPDELLRELQQMQKQPPDQNQQQQEQPPPQ